MTSDLNPDKFTDRPHEQVEDMAQKGEKQSRQGGFANMDPSKQRDITSKGGQFSGDSFRPGGQKTQEVGNMGGSRQGYLFDDWEEHMEEYM